MEDDKNRNNKTEPEDNYFEKCAESVPESFQILVSDNCIGEASSEESVSQINNYLRREFLKNALPKEGIYLNNIIGHSQRT